METLNNKTVVLGVTGSIAAYKAADLASQLTKTGARVEVVMTEAAQRFIAPLTFQALTGRKPVDMFAPDPETAAGHISLAAAANIVVIAPATANIIAKLAGGIADDTLTCTVLATRAPVLIAPAMHTNMLRNTATQQNLTTLKALGFTVIEPGRGHLASGDSGEGRLAEIINIMDALQQVLGKSRDLSGRRIVVTAGGTQEPIDPVRFIGNRSSGKMGYALAIAARDRAATVELMTAPTSLPTPAGIKVIPVRTAAEMKEAVAKSVRTADALIMAAAVADYQPKDIAPAKIKKDSPGLKLELIRTPDILAEVKGDFIRVGFAAESEDLIANAGKKLAAKGLDLIVANDITEPESGFEADTNRVTIIDQAGKVENLPLMSKREAADRILDRVRELAGFN